MGVGLDRARAQFLTLCLYSIGAPGDLEAHGPGILGSDPFLEALLAWAVRESSEEALGALLTEWVDYLY